MSCIIEYLVNLNSTSIKTYAVGRNGNKRTAAKSYDPQQTHDTNYTIPHLNTTGAIALEAGEGDITYVWRTDAQILYSPTWPSNDGDGFIAADTSSHKYVLAWGGSNVTVKPYDSSDIISKGKAWHDQNSASVSDASSKISSYLSSSEGKSLMSNMKTAAKAGGSPSTDYVTEFMNGAGISELYDGISFTLAATGDGAAVIGVDAGDGAIVGVSPAQIGFYSSLALTIGLDIGVSAGGQFGVWFSKPSSVAGLYQAAIITVELEVGVQIGIYFNFDGELTGVTIGIVAGAEAGVTYAIGNTTILGLTPSTSDVEAEALAQ